MTVSFSHPSGARWTIRRTNDNHIAVSASGHFTPRHAEELAEAIRYEAARAAEMEDPRVWASVVWPTR
jgi:hypothetical protein